MPGLNGLMAAFNRTILELKQLCEVEKQFVKQSFNRTILELKLANIRGKTALNFLLIEPFWN